MSRIDSLQEITGLLEATPYFGGLDAAALHKLARPAVRQEFGAGQIIFSEGEPCAGLLVVQEGWLKTVKISPSGREQVICVAGPGELCNEIAVFGSVPNPATAIALEPAIVWSIPRDSVLRLLEEVPAVARMVSRGLARRVLHMLTMVEDLSLRTVEARLARLLLERASDGTLHRHRWATQEAMAARLGTVPDVLNRELKKLADRGLIRVARQQIEILDSVGLEARASAEE
jgi:CRP/FNR family cyclic AMP-dependent transcriptional regulator